MIDIRQVWSLIPPTPVTSNICVAVNSKRRFFSSADTFSSKRDSKSKEARWRDRNTKRERGVCVSVPCRAAHRICARLFPIEVLWIWWRWRVSHPWWYDVMCHRLRCRCTCHSLSWLTPLVSARSQTPPLPHTTFSDQSCLVCPT